MIGTVSPAPQAPAKRESVLAGKHQVQHEQVRRIALQLLVDLARVGQRLHLKALFAQVTHEQIAQADVIVDDEYLGCCRLYRWHARRGG